MTEPTAQRTRSGRPGRPPRPGAHRPDRVDGGLPLLPRPVHRQHRVPEHLKGFPRGEPQFAVVGAQRVHDRLRRRARPRRPLGRPGRAQASLPARPGHLHRIVRALRRRPVARLPRGGPRPAGHRRCAHAAHVARAAPPRVRAGAQGRRHRPVVGGRWRRRRLRPADRWAAGAGELALGLPGEPPLQPPRARVRRPPSHRGPGPRGAQVGSARRGAPDRGGRQPRGRARPGPRLGLGQRASSAPSLVAAGRHRGSWCARSATRTRFWSPPSSATGPWHWPTSAPSPSSAASEPSCWAGFSS